MTVRNNVHIPKESWPHWTWYAIEFGIVLAIAMLVSRSISDFILKDVAAAVGQAGALESWEGITIHSKEFLALPMEVSAPIVSMSNWIFYAIVGAIFLGWYIIIRGFIIKKPIFKKEN